MLGSWIDQDKQEITIILTNFPCSYNQCTHCPFEIESIDDGEEIMITNKQIINESLEKVTEFNLENVKIFNGGSFFELPDDVFPILKSISEGRNVSIESRPEFLSKKSISLIFDKLQPLKLNIFIGFDSADEVIRNKLLNKGIPKSELDRISNDLKNIKNVQFFSYVLFGIKGISEESVKDSVLYFNKNLNGVSAIEFRENPKTELKHQNISEQLKKFLIQNCINVDFIGDDDEQWLLPEKRS
ncbi:MAG: hypothetical protein HWN67_04680 [Candidatus Helarchaeota archaeon]|nr:hypothetical protein [Candidatus Helarchaeota archaeon]